MELHELEWATCDTCGASDYCISLGEDEHICIRCESAPRKQKEYQDALDRIKYLEEDNARLKDIIKDTKKMNWTKEIPAVDGYYWVKSSFMPEDSWIDEIKDSKAVVWNYGVDEYEEVFDYSKSKEYTFYGPLEEPK